MERIISITQGKLKEIEANTMLNISWAKLKEIGANTMLNTAWTKLKEVGGEKIMNTLLEKLKELPLELKKFGAQFMGRFYKKFPPETRNERLNQWIHFAGKSAKALIVIGLILIVLYLFFHGKPGKMMKAPGRNYRMPRKNFQDNPKSYFLNLRASKKKN